MNTPAQCKRETRQSTATMKAVRVYQFGGPNMLSFETIERPQPGEGEVLLRVHAAGVGPWDGWVRAGQSALPQPLPLTPGADLSGIVEAVGSGVTAFKTGDPVFGVTNGRFVGAYAEYALADAAMLAAKPKGIDHLEAASVPVVAVTAWQALFQQAEVERGQTVLIHGAAGNVGAYAVQLAHSAGVRVIATVSARDAAYVRSLGADRVVDYRAERFEDAASCVNAVIDLVGGETQARSFAVVKPGGALISAVSEPDKKKAAAAGVRARFFLVNVSTAALRRIAEKIEAGELKTDVGTVLPLASARNAHEMLSGDRSHPRGKIVLKVA